MRAPTHHVGAHGVARPQREEVGDGALLLDVLRHAGRVFGESLRVDEPVELIQVRRYRQRYVLGVARDANVLYNVCKRTKCTLVKCLIHAPNV